MKCDCISSIGEKLKPYNTKLSLALAISNDRVVTASIVVSTEKLDKQNKKKPVCVPVRFCPFCGVDTGN